MKLIVCVKRDLAGSIALNHLLPYLKDLEVQILLSNVTRPIEMQTPELAELKFFERDLPMGTFFPLLDRQPIADTKAYYTFNQIERLFDIPCRCVADINGARSLSEIRAFAPDLILSIRFSLIFAQPIIDIPKYGILNLHPGALPEYAGLFAPFRALLNGDERLGCTLHFIDRKIDHGPIIGIRYLEADRSKSLFWHINALYPRGIELFGEVLETLRNDKRPRTLLQDQSQRHYRSLPSEQEFQRFRERGLQLVDKQEYLETLTRYLPAKYCP